MSFKNKISHLKNNDEGHGLAGKNKSLAIKHFDKILKKERRRQKFGKPETTLNNLHKHNERTSNKEQYQNNSKFSKYNGKNMKQQKQDEKLQAEALAKQKAEEKALALIKRKEDRLKKFKVLSKRTSKGQPIMGHRMNMLLDKIQKQN